MKDKIVVSLKNKTFLKELICYFLFKAGILNKGIVNKARVNIVYKKLKKEFKIEKIKNIYNFQRKKNIDYKNVIWIFWYQGISEAPEIVKSCYKSVLKQFSDKKIILITKENFSDYVDIPQFILEKLDNNILSITHFSDILRTMLLVTYGGLWLDATVFCTGKNDYNYFSELDLFVYRDGWFDNLDINMANWLIWSKPNNIILEQTLLLLLEYWRKKNYLCEYFVYHLFFRIVTEEYEESWKKVPYINHIDNHLLINDIFNKFDLDRFKFITKLTDFHKLTYKLDISKEIKGTFLEYIIK